MVPTEVCQTCRAPLAEKTRSSKQAKNNRNGMDKPT